jgi:hypothetical protein
MKEYITVRPAMPEILDSEGNVIKSATPEVITSTEKLNSTEETLEMLQALHKNKLFKKE